MAEVKNIMDRAYPFVRQAIANGVHGHGRVTDDPIRAAAILTEEVGEVMSEALAMTRNSSSPMEKEQSRQNLIDELAQVASVAMQMIANHAVDKDFGDA